MNGWQIFLIILGAILLVGFIVFTLRNRITEIGLDVFKIFKINAKAKRGKSLEVPNTTGETARFNQTKMEYLSHVVLRGLQVELKKTRGQHTILDTTRENFRTAAHVYGHLQGDIIATCFFEDPDYGASDLSESLIKESRLYRLTLRALCDSNSEKTIRNRFAQHPSKQTLIVLENNVEISKIGGMFCRCNDGSHLAFIALNNYCGTKPSNRGLIFCGDLAEVFFNYYNSFINKYA